MRSIRLSSTPRHLGFVSTLLLILAPASMSAQPWTFGGPDADLGYDVAATPDGGFAAVGFTSQGNLIDGFVVRADSTGTPIWQRSLTLSPLSEQIFDVIPTADGGFVVVGSADLPEVPDYRPWLVKLDAAGDEVWNTGDDFTATLPVDSGIVRGTELISGNLLIVGGASSMTNPENPWVVKVDPHGQLVSFEIYPTLGTPGFGVATYIHDVTATPDGGAIVTGTVSGGTGFAYLWKLDADGLPEWDHLFQAEGFRSGESVTVLEDGGFLAVGCDLPNCTHTAALRTDSAGQVAWFRTYTDPEGFRTLGRDTMERVDGTLVLLQNRYSAVGSPFFETDLLELDAAGEILQTHPLSAGSTSTALLRLTPSSDMGDFLAVGSSNDSTDPNAIDLLVVRDSLPSAGVIFTDDFENGHMGAWSGFRP